MHKWRAMGARPRANPEINVQHISHEGRISVGHIKRHNGSAPRSRATIHAHTRQISHGILELRRKPLRRFAYSINADTFYIFHTCEQTRYSMCVQRARFQALGHKRRMGTIVAMGSGSSHFEGFDFRTFRYNQPTRALGSIQALMPRETYDIDVLRPHIYRNNPCSLRRVYNHNRSMSMSDLCHFRYIVHISRQV